MKLLLLTIISSISFISCYYKDLKLEEIKIVSDAIIVSISYKNSNNIPMPYALDIYDDKYDSNLSFVQSEVEVKQLKSQKKVVLKASIQNRGAKLRVNNLYWFDIHYDSKIITGRLKVIENKYRMDNVYLLDFSKYADYHVEVLYYNKVGPF